MAAIGDLTPCCDLPVFADHILAVGWLGKTSAFCRGPTPEAVYQRLRSFAKNPWQPFITCGCHECELCQFSGEQSGAANLYIPHQGKIYVAPELVTHYINAHYYQPPLEFCEAVLACPAMDSMDYKRLLIACNGRVLWNERA